MCNSGIINRAGQVKENYIRILVNNLSSTVTEKELRQEFGLFGDVTSIILAKNRYDGSPRGFCFVEMLRESEGHAAVMSLNGKVLGGLTLKVEAIRNWSQFGTTI